MVETSVVVDFNTEIEMLLYDENKIVTYKLLNHKFNITPNEAKRKLNEFVEKYRNNTTNSRNLVFFVTYLVIAYNEKEKRNCVVLVNQQDFENFTLENKILSKQIYSIQKNFVEDFNLFYGSDLNISNDNSRKSNLKTIDDNMRSASDSIANNSVNQFGDKSKVESQTIVKNEAKTTVVKNEPNSTVAKQESKMPMESETKTEKKVAIDSKTANKASSSDQAIKKPQANSIASMFGKQKEMPKKKEKDEVDQMGVEEPVINSVEMKSSESTDSLGKETKLRKVIEDLSIADDGIVLESDEEATKKTEKKLRKAKKIKTVDAEQQEAQVKSDLFDDEAHMENEINPQTSAVKTTDEDDDEYEDDQVNKKRRRKNKKNTRVLNSDDDDDNVSADKRQASKKSKPKTPSDNKEIDKMFNKENHQASTTDSSDMNGSKKKQMVTKTYIDDDGYQVTKKVWETVVNDEPVDVEKKSAKEDKITQEVAKKPVKADAKAKPLNQPTLANFFKKS